MVFRNKIKQYHKFLDKPINNKQVFIESMLGSTISGELFYVTKHILGKHKDYKIVLSIKRRKIFIKSFGKQAANRVILVKRGTIAYYKGLASSKFLISDVTFKKEFIKRKNQIYYNTWHGTPMKTLGIDIKKSGGINSISNVQKNFLLADGLIIDNDWTKDILNSKYLLNNEGNFLSFATFKSGLQTKRKTKDALKVLIALTWKSGFRDKINFKKIIKYIDKLILEHPKHMRSNEYVLSLHHFYNKYNRRRWFRKNLKNIRLLKENEEITQVAINSDVVASDFSSIVFDVKDEKKVVLDFSQVESYKKSRGLYDKSIEDNDFEKKFILFKFVDSFFNRDESKKFVSKDKLDNIKYKSKFKFNPNNTWVENLFGGKPSINRDLNNDVLIYPGTLATNGLTTSFRETLRILLSENKKVTIFYSKKYMSSIDSIKDLIDNKNVTIKVSEPLIIFNFFDRVTFSLWKRNSFIAKLFKKSIRKRLDKHYSKEAYSIFGSNVYKKVIHFTGYENYVAELFNWVKSKEKIVYVHNDMLQEWKKRRNFTRDAVYTMYDRYDKLIFVSEYLMKDMQERSTYFKLISSKSTFINNPTTQIDIKTINRSIPNNNAMTGDIRSIFISKLMDPNVHVITNIGRFSNEKNQSYLLKEYKKLRKAMPNQNIILLFVGSLRKLNRFYATQIIFRAMLSKYSKDIYFFENIDVYPILKFTDTFVLPSKHEGYPMVNMEAALMGVDVLSSNLPGNVEQNEKYGISQNFDIKKKNDLLNKLRIDVLKRNRKVLQKVNIFNVERYNKKIKEQIKERLINEN